jgi:hypothetical protein
MPVSQGSVEESAGATRMISAKDALFLAQALLKEGRVDDAEKIYTALRADQNEEIRIESLFQLAQIRLAQNRFRQAISLFLEILNKHPNLPRVRLELARAYFLDKNYEDAAFQFELVKGGDLPPEVLANVDIFLDAIRREKNWSFNFSLSPVTNSNINQASGSKEECIDTIFGTLCRPLEEKSSGMGLSADASVDYFWRFHQDWGLRATAGFYGLAYEHGNYDEYSLYSALGPRYLWESGEASLQPFFRKRWLGGRRYSDEYGLRLDTRQIFGRLLLNAGGSYSVSNYTNEYVRSVLKGSSWSLRLQPRYILTGQIFIQSGLEFLREDTKVKSFANDNWRYSLGAYHAFSYGFSLFAEGSLTDTKYGDSQWYVTKDNRIDEAVRKDKTWRLLASLSSNLLERYNLTPILQYAYTKRNSNIWSREYKQHRLNLLCNYRF